MTAVTGLGNAYNMAPDLATVLAVIAIAVSGDPLTSRWSIGGSFSPAVPLFPATGLLGTHNQYENDASMFRVCLRWLSINRHTLTLVQGDAYLYNGNVDFFEMRSWEHFYAMGEEYTLDNGAAQSDYSTRWSILNNPYYFSGPFSGLVPPAGHNFAINLMSNHSAEQPGGTLTREVLKSFFAVTGDTPGNFVHNRGQERIPENWYKRPLANAYNLVDAVADILTNNAVSRSGSS